MEGLHVGSDLLPEHIRVRGKAHGLGVAGGAGNGNMTNPQRVKGDTKSGGHRWQRVGRLLLRQHATLLRDSILLAESQEAVPTCVYGVQTRPRGTCALELPQRSAEETPEEQGQVDRRGAQSQGCQRTLDPWEELHHRCQKWHH